ncbi:MAG: hypothetical protein ACK46A_00515 [Akkermansiaceae bacterium]|jgi:hypothetical protein|nr:hypothetical protein [Luteolibacter sp.]
MIKLPNTEINEQAPALVAAPVIARRISATPRYILQLAAAGKIPVVRIGQKCVRFDPHAVAQSLGFIWEGSAQ